MYLVTKEDDDWLALKIKAENLAYEAKIIEERVNEGIPVILVNNLDDLLENIDFDIDEIIIPENL